MGRNTGAVHGAYFRGVGVVEKLMYRRKEGHLRSGAQQQEPSVMQLGGLCNW
jgi:hypothetical protein